MTYAWWTTPDDSVKEASGSMERVRDMVRAIKMMSAQGLDNLRSVVGPTQAKVHPLHSAGKSG